MHLQRKRLAALGAIVGAMTVAGPIASASAAPLPTALPTTGLPTTGLPTTGLPRTGLPTGLPALPATGLPAFTPGGLNFTGPSVHIATVIGPTIIGSVVMEGPGAAGQVAAGAPQAISLLSNSGLTGAAGIPGLP